VQAKHATRMTVPNSLRWTRAAELRQYSVARIIKAGALAWSAIYVRGYNGVQGREFSIQHPQGVNISQFSYNAHVLFSLDSPLIAHRVC